ncbi:MAG: hypothetical protein LBD79_07015 [Treponema sp.]|jgi:hypothetical protein|nr:hypothetical protein [Treponema sp.]
MIKVSVGEQDVRLIQIQFLRLSDDLIGAGARDAGVMELMVKTSATAEIFS